MKSMKLQTKHFGEVTYQQPDIIHFDVGLPGFRANKNFILLADSPTDFISWLQSTENGDLAFVLMDVKQVMPSYSPIIEEAELAGLLTDNSEAAKSDIYIYNIAIVPEDVNQTCVNLQAPIVINQATRKGRQVLASNEEYGLRHYIFADPENGAARNNDGGI